MAPEKRDTMITVRVSEAEADMLRVLADEDGISASDIVRTLIRREYAARHGKLKRSPRS